MHPAELILWESDLSTIRKYTSLPMHTTSPINRGGLSLGVLAYSKGSLFMRGTEYAEVEPRFGLGPNGPPDWMNKKTFENEMDRSTVIVPYDMVYRFTGEYTGIYPARVMSEPGKTIQKRSRTPSP